MNVYCHPHDPGWLRAVTEDTELNPVGEYEQTKAVADWLILEAVRRSVVVPIISRLSIVLGANMYNPSMRQLAEFVRRVFSTPATAVRSRPTFISVMWLMSLSKQS